MNKSRGGQICKVIIKDGKQIKNSLKKIQTTDKKKFPRMVELNTSEKDTINGIITVRYVESSSNMVEELYFEFDLAQSRLYIIGRGTGRDTVVNEFNRHLDSNPSIKSIQNIKLNGQSIYIDMLKIIKKIDDEHFVKTLKAKFGLNGQKSPLDKHKLMEIQYGFVNNICASKHKNSEIYASNALSCRIKFAVWKIGNFSRLKIKNKRQLDPMIIEVSTDYSFRFFWDYDAIDILSVMRILTVDPDIYTENI